MKPSRPPELPKRPELSSKPPPEPPAPRLSAGAGLRRRAEEILKAQTQSAFEPKLVHELQIHQIELEMQNDELQKARAEMEAALARYTDLYDFAPAGYFTLSPASEISWLRATESTRLYRRQVGSPSTHAQTSFC